MASSSASSPSSTSIPSSTSSRMRKNASGARTDVGWEHGMDLGDRKVKCKYCDKVYTGGIFRFKHHLARTSSNVGPCPKVPEDVKVKFLKLLEDNDISTKKKRGMSSIVEVEEMYDRIDNGRGMDSYVSKKGKGQITINAMFKKDERERVCQQIARFFYTSAIPFNCVNNPEFKKMIQMIGDFGRGLDPPSYHEMRGYFLNPMTQYSPDYDCHSGFIKAGLYTCLQRMCPDSNLAKTINCQFDKFRNARGLFGLEVAKLTRNEKSPVDWWDSYGDETPELKRFAMRILSLTCSSSGCERNWSSFEMIHSKRRNRLHQQKMNDLVYVMYNLKLSKRDENHEKRLEAECLDLETLNFDDVSSDDEWITEEDTTHHNANEEWINAFDGASSSRDPNGDGGTREGFVAEEENEDDAIFVV